MKKSKLLTLLPLLLLSSCGEEKRTPLGWCLWEIQMHSGYEDLLFYSSKEIPNSILKAEYSGKNDLYGYIVETYTDEMKTEWWCYIETKKTIFKTIPSDYVVYVDCDEIYSVNFSEVEENGN